MASSSWLEEGRMYAEVRQRRHTLVTGETTLKTSISLFHSGLVLSKRRPWIIIYMISGNWFYLTRDECVYIIYTAGAPKKENPRLPKHLVCFQQSLCGSESCDEEYDSLLRTG